MSEDTTTQSQSTKSTSQRLSWLGSDHPFVNLHLVFWLILMIPSTVYLAVIWLLASMSHKGLVSVLTLDESEESTQKSGVEKFSTQVLYPSLRNSSQLLDAVRRTGLEEDQPLSTFLSGIKKLQTSWSSRITKEPKTTESENSTTASS